MSPEQEIVEFEVDSAGLSPSSLKHLFFKKLLRTVSRATPIFSIEIDDDQVLPDLVMERTASADAHGPRGLVTS